MKKRTKITLWSILFVIVFTVSALIRVNMLGSAPMKLMQVKWDDTVAMEVDTVKKYRPPYFILCVLSFSSPLKV